MSVLLSDDLVTGFVAHLNLELTAHQAYSALANYCSLPSVSYPGFAKLFRREADEEWTHARKFMDYIIRRGNNFPMPAIKEVDIEDRTDMIKLLETAMELELEVLASMNNLHSECDGANDVDAAVFLDDFIREQTEAIAELDSKITIVRRLSSDVHGLYHYDRDLLE